MKYEIRMALLALATTSVPAFAQDVPECAAIYNSTQEMFSAKGAPAGAVNSQCFLTVMPKDGPNSLAGFPQLARYPSPQLQEGTYEILLSGGGGGGGAGGLLSSGGGGAGAVPSKTTQYLSPGVYKLTIGTSGLGGTNGGNGGNGNPTSITKAYTNELIAGYGGADNSSGAGSAGGAANGQGAQGYGGQSSGGAGGRQPDRNGNGEVQSQSGGMLQVAGVPTGQPGVGGRNDGGGGGGAGFGDGGSGNAGDRGGNARAGNEGGDGFVRLRPIQLAQATPVAVPVQAAPAEVAPAPYVAPARAAKRDRN